MVWELGIWQRGSGRGTSCQVGASRNGVSLKLVSLNATSSLRAFSNVGDEGLILQRCQVDFNIGEGPGDRSTRQR